MPFIINLEQSCLDEPIAIRLSGLLVNQKVTIRLNAVDQQGVAWRSQAEFVADASGMIDLSKQAPIAGSYHGIDPFGLFWSLLPVDKADSQAYFAVSSQSSVMEWTRSTLNHSKKMVLGI